MCPNPQERSRMGSISCYRALNTMSFLRGRPLHCLPAGLCSIIITSYIICSDRILRPKAQHNYLASSTWDPVLSKLLDATVQTGNVIHEKRGFAPVEDIQHPKDFARFKKLQATHQQTRDRSQAVKYGVNQGSLDRHSGKSISDLRFTLSHKCCRSMEAHLFPRWYLFPFCKFAYFARMLAISTDKFPRGVCPPPCRLKAYHKQFYNPSLLRF
ncbi:hypothetical protein F4775DRAFT_313298 [Biscogniauxia sp. FL1348]|nr:hypothetical protein F4775DRAFT_313298 [Biscogniauxia sp. FL1348]